MPETSSRCLLRTCRRSGLADKLNEVLYRPLQLFTSLHLPGVAVCFRQILLQLGKPWDKVIELVFDIFALLEVQYVSESMARSNRDARRSVL